MSEPTTSPFISTLSRGFHLYLGSTAWPSRAYWGSRVCCSILLGLHLAPCSLCVSHLGSTHFHLRVFALTILSDSKALILDLCTVRGQLKCHFWGEAFPRPASVKLPPTPTSIRPARPPSHILPHLIPDSIWFMYLFLFLPSLECKPLEGRHSVLFPATTSAP